MVDSMFSLSLDPSKGYYNSNITNTSTMRGDRDKFAMAMSQLPNPMQMVNNVENSDRDPMKAMPSDNPMQRPDLHPMVMQNNTMNPPMPMTFDPASPNSLIMQSLPVIQPPMNNPNMMRSGMPSGLVASNMSSLGSNMMPSNMAGLPGFQGNSNMPGMPNTDGNNSLFFNQNNNGVSF